MAVPVVALYGSLNALLNVALALNVSRVRNKHRVSLGHGENDAVLRASRAHGNNAEFVPLGIVVLLLAELSGGSSLWLHVLGGSLFVARVLQAWGIYIPKAPNPQRFIGTAVTWIMIAATSIYTLLLRT